MFGKASTKLNVLNCPKWFRNSIGDKIDQNELLPLTLLFIRKKKYDFQANIFELCLDCVERGVVPAPVVIQVIMMILNKLECFSIQLTRPWIGKGNTQQTK